MDPRRLYTASQRAQDVLSNIRTKRGGWCLTVHKSVPAVRIHFPPPTSLRFEAFSGDDRKKRACGRDACVLSAPERVSHLESCRVTSNFSLSASNSVPIPAVGNATSRQEASTSD